MSKKKIIIVGGGPAGMMAAAILAPTHDIHIYDKEKSIGKKFLVAGKGGFNITNSAQGEELTKRYSPEGFLTKALLDFDSPSVRKWLESLDIPTFIGSSGRVFPEKGIKPIEVLQQIKNHLLESGVTFHLDHEFTDFNDKEITFLHQQKEHTESFDYLLFCLGGASWSVTGSNGKWLPIFQKNGIETVPFQASNCGVNIDWPESVVEFHEGKPLKNISVTIGEITKKGEALITEYGLEGNVIYPLTRKIREVFRTQKEATLYIDFKPNNTAEQLLKKVGNSNPKSYGKTLNLTSEELAIIKAFTSKEEYLNPLLFAHRIKNIEIPTSSLRPIEEAISTVGGVATSELNADFSLRKYTNVFTIGEMADWDAPTGGFLLQGCFSMANWAAKSILQKEKQ